jgi:4-hydroxymandelate oxidase
MDLQSLLNLRDVETAARDRIAPIHFDYVAGGARDEHTVNANESAFTRLQLLPRMLRGNEKRVLDTTVLGSPLSMPILLSPSAFHRLFHPGGECATARAAAAAQTVMIASMAATTSIADIAAAARAQLGGADPDLWFQLYIQPDLEITDTLVKRATEAGCRALVVTIDSPVLGAQERNWRHGFNDLPAGLACENLRNLRAGEPGHIRQIVMSGELTWDHIDWLRGITDLPIVLKGALHPEDARIALEHGVQGLLLSNHGGRQLDGVPSTIELLPDIVAAVQGRVPVILDGGVRRGTDVVKALALGAAAVGVARPTIWGLATGGEDGVSRVLEILRSELDHAMALCGASSLADLTPELVRLPGWGSMAGPPAAAPGREVRR